MNRKCHLAVCRPGFAAASAAEFLERFGIRSEVVHPAAVALPVNCKLPHLGSTVFTRQYLPHTTSTTIETSKQGVSTILQRLQVMAGRNNHQTGRWTLHVYGVDDDPAIGLAIDIQQQVHSAIVTASTALGVPSAMAKRYVGSDRFASAEPEPGDRIVQGFVTSRNSGGAFNLWLSASSTSDPATPGLCRYMAACAPTPAMTIQIPGAPSRSARKLAEALVYIYDSCGIRPLPGETAVDLGAAPGGWSLVMARHGVNVAAIDHGELKLPAGTGIAGEIRHILANGLNYRPDDGTDWLCCDMVVGAQQSLDVLCQWLEARMMRRFIVNMKLPQASENSWETVKGALKRLEPFVSRGDTKCDGLGLSFFRVRHLYHDRSEVTLMGAF